MSRGQNFKRVKCHGGEMSRGRNVTEAKCPEGEMSRGLNVWGRIYIWDEMSRGRNVMGAKCQRRRFEFTLLEHISKKYSGGKRRFKKSNFLIKQIF